MPAASFHDQRTNHGGNMTEPSSYQPEPTWAPPAGEPVPPQWHLPPAPPKTGPSARQKWMIAGLVVAIIGVGLTVGGKLLLRHSDFTTVGTVTFTSTSGGMDGLGTKCFGRAGYGDLIPGGAVDVTDNAGKTVAIGTITDNGTTVGSSTCVLPFTVSGVPAGKRFYGVTVTHRGVVQFTEAQMKAGVSLKIG